MRIAMLQTNPVVGDVDGNAAGLFDGYSRATQAGADLVVSGELSLTGYPPDDLLLRAAFLDATTDALERLAREIGSVPLVVGAPVPTSPEEGLHAGVTVSEAPSRRWLGNAAVVLRDGAVLATYRKRRIPNYGVFDEARYFLAVDRPTVVHVAGRAVGFTVCEDLWDEAGPVSRAAQSGADVVVNINASPFYSGKRAERERWARHHATTSGLWLVYVNLVGGQDEVVFDGDSFVVAPDGRVVARGAELAPGMTVTDLDDPPSDLPARLDDDVAVYAALVLATRDYLAKNGFSDALVGVSGGIDSALTAAIAVDALGPQHVTGVAMPSPHSSPGSLADARKLCELLGARYLELPIAAAMTAVSQTLAEPFAGTEEGIAEENIQSRLRGLLLMALSNKHGDLVLATGNKSEYAVGYATLYGDMVGGLAPLKDVWKTQVFRLAHRRNTEHHEDWRGPAGPVIPQSTIDKPPSAELRPGQLDTDTLPDYDVLDPILRAYVEEAKSVRQVAEDGFDPETVAYVARLVDRAEYKRRQSAPGVKVTARAFGRDRRLPITNAWRSVAPDLALPDEEVHDRDVSSARSPA